MTKHTFYECTCNHVGCQFCDGGLGWCTVCDGFEGTLPTECPGRKITEEEAAKIYKWKSLDFINGEWVEKLAVQQSTKE